MKKTNAIQLVLITAAMTACYRPLYQQRTEGYEDPGYSAGANPGPPTAGYAAGPAAGPVTSDGAPGPMTSGRPAGDSATDWAADAPDSTNSCPVESSCLPPDYYDWYNGPGAFGSVSLSFNINGYYAYQNPPPVRVNPIRSLLTRTFANIAGAHARMTHPSALRPTTNHPAVARSGFGARAASAAHS
jgi:hypothetical protein